MKRIDSSIMKSSKRQVCISLINFHQFFKDDIEFTIQLRFLSINIPHQSLADVSLFVIFWPSNKEKEMKYLKANEICKEGKPNWE